MDRASRARARVDLILRGSRVQMPAVRYRFEAKGALAMDRAVAAAARPAHEHEALSARASALALIRQESR